MKEVKTLEDYKEAVKEGTVLVKVGHDFCGPCKLTEGNIKSIESEYPDVSFIKVDTNECDEDIINELNVMSVPVILVYNNGELVRRENGLRTADQLKTYLV